MSIGDFAAMTGISVKALRHYDREGVLKPAEVDPATGHRRYTLDQVRAGVVVKTLRSAGLPLPAAAAAVATSSERAAVEAHRAQVLAERRDEDARHSAALLAVTSLAEPLEAYEREAGPQHFVGWRMDAEEAEADTDAGDVADPGGGVDDMLARMAEVGLTPEGPHWTTTRARGHDGSESVLCWPVSAVPPHDQVHGAAIAGTLPGRTEVFVRWRFDPEAVVLPTVAPIVALAHELARRGAAHAPFEIRHRVLTDERGSVMELAATV